IACLLVIISLIILSYSVKQPTRVGFFRELILETAAPLASMITASFKDLAGVWKRYILLVGLEDENERLKRDNALLIQEINRYREGYLENIRLQKLLALKERTNHHTIAAMVIGRDQTSIVKTILINKGTSHGLRLDLPVIADQGVVGRIVETSAHVSRVLLLIDENSNTDALIQENRIQGILQGAASLGCSLKYVPKSETVSVGNTVVTSGLSGLFPKGLLLGVVKNVEKTDSGLFQQIDVAPFVDFSRLEEVMVIVLDKTDNIGKSRRLN
ncbi:MAG: rod shape-determining protein MreC, partial [Syntrophales bacterium LBB04]|nr:rod shape-determining protein MreC [Syntrophales bacterium LBB04]